MERLVGQTLSRYKITDLLGEGGMGAVFKAQDVTLQRDVAIKIMHPHMANQPNFRERFLQEARTAARLDHPGIVQVYDFGQERSLLFIVMNFIRGTNLRQMLEDLRAQGKWIPLDEAVQIIRQVSLAMHYAHRQGVLHRDLKPSNIMIEPDPSNGLAYRPILTDLGLARLMEGQRITRAGTSMGTPTYMSPEQAMGEETDARSDVYALGIMLYELCVARPPFAIKTLSEAIRYHTKEAPPPPREIRADLPANLERVILKAIAKDPAQRWANADAFAQALADLDQEVTAVAGTPTALGTSVSLMTQYQKSLTQPRGASVLKEFTTPSGTGDTVQARLPDGSTTEAHFVDNRITIGRAEDNDLTLQTTNVSRHHARIDYEGGTYRVIDLDSTNGTYIGNAKLLPGVPETWTPEQPLRVGDAWLRLVVSHDRVSTSRLAGAGSAAAATGATRIDRSMVRTSTGEGRVGVVMDETQLSVAPGERAVSSVVILNQGAIVDHFQVAIEGIPADWADLPPVVQLMPGEQQEVTFTLHPPRTPASRAGRYTLTVRVISRDVPGQFVEVKAALTVTAYSQFQSSVQPQKVRAGKSTRVTVRNDGNFPDTYMVTGSDRGNELAFDPPQARLKVPQGGTASAELSAKPHKRPFIGGTKNHPFNIKISSTEGATQQHAGEVISRGIIPPWVPPLLIGILLIACIALAMFLSRAPVIELAEIDPTNPIAGEPVTVRWRVNNARRIELRPFGIELDPDVGEYTFEDGFADTATLSLVAFGLVRSTQETLAISVEIPVVEAETPVINEWSVFPTEITQGQEVTIRWSVSNAESIKVQPFGTVDSSGERTDRPQQTETYTLIATNQGKNVEQSQRVAVATPSPDAPEITSFTVSPSTVVEGVDTTIRLTWETKKADTVTIEPGLGPVGLTGSRDVPIPANDTIYTLMAKGPGGEIPAQVQVMVEQQRCFTASGTLNLRSGPGTVYDPPIASLPAGTEVTPLAYSAVGYPDDQWVNVQVVGSSEEGWVASSFLVDCNVDVTGLGGGVIPPTPKPPFTVSNVQASVTPQTFSGACPKSFNFTADITVNDAGTVEYVWERSDGSSGTPQTVDFAGAGTKTVNTSWSLSAAGEKWQHLRIIAPNGLTSNQATFTLECISEALYIYNTDSTMAQQYKHLLDAHDFDFDIIKMNSILSANYSNYKLILIGPDTGSGSTWGDAAGTQAQKLEDTGLPIVGIGKGGYAFFGKLGYPIGYGKGWSGSGRDVYAANVDDSVWNKVYDINIPGSRIVQLYSSNSGFTAIHYPNPISGILGLGRQSNDTTHYQIIEKDVQYILWGFNDGPLAMTDTGRKVFVNTARSSMEKKFFLLKPVPLIELPMLELNP